MATRIIDYRQLYLEDLEKPVSYNGEPSRARVYNVEAWKQLPTSILQESSFNKKDILNHNVWVWSDPHFFHKNIIKYCNRPYPSVELMNQCLIGNFNNVVGESDVSIWVGDIGFASDQRINEVLNQLNGYRILVIGNHDFTHHKVRSLHFHEIHLLYHLYIEDDELDLVFTHYPMDNLPIDVTNVHGHLHEKSTGNPQHINVSVDCTGFKPINLKTIIQQAKKRAELFK